MALGVLADALLADPRRGHPVAGFGRAAAALERATWRDSRAAGVRYTALAVGVPVVAAALLQRRAARSPLAETALTAVSTWAVLGGTSLGREADLMARHLQGGDLSAARGRLSHLCARDPSGLGEKELARATVESVAENTGDAVVAPLFWGAVAGVPGLVGYRAVNTLDAMVGYRNERHTNFGWASARLDDVANLLPARLTGLLTVPAARAVGGSPRRAAAVLAADRRVHPSPNAGWCEAAAAGALDVRLGGANTYHGAVETRGTLHAAGREPEVADIGRAVRLSRAVGLGAAALAVIAAGLTGRQGRSG
ncbi:cobalamin biosynthesis protein [Sporichthya brevicatena]|uniref:Cobalamin biosynthesis protein CobD n=1 Tax=Sporichthya brevicatena TaxID=171442 RepID=A0ABP3S2F4_9ACTN